MRNVTATTTARWRGQFKTADAQPHVRVTIQPLTLAKFRGPEYVKDNKDNVYTSMIFGQNQPVRELPNVRSVSISRLVEQDVQTCTIELWNTEDIPIGATLTTEDLANHERPGWYTFNHGDPGNPWSQTASDWREWIVPDRIIRTYEGYGINPTVAADKDANMYPSGVWLIDKVVLTAEGTIRLECRDPARELLEQIMFLPVVPTDYYPMVWEKKHPVGGRKVVQPTGGVLPLTYQSDSNLPYIGRGLVDGSAPYVQADGGVRGHRGRDAFDGSDTSYWLSVGNKSRQSTSAYEWVQGTPASPAQVRGVRVKAWGGPYTVYISVKVGGEWQGKRDIGYKANLVDAGTDIPFVAKGTIGRDKTKWFKIPFKNPATNAPYTGVQAIRVTMHRLFDSKLGDYPYRAGIRDVRYTTEIDVETVTEYEGNYSDYADIVKTILAWGGFYWPPAATGRSTVRSSDGTSATLAQTSSDPVLARGRVWGDLMDTGVGGVDETKLEAQIWDQKPLMDAIRYVQDIVAYLFFLDETGGVIFRQPNIWQYGNYVSGEDGGPNTGRTTDVIILDDTTDLLSHTLTLSSTSRRDVVFVGNGGTGRQGFGALAYAYNPWPSGTRRVGGWTDQNFESADEAETMAQLIAVRMALKGREATVEVAGNPAIQIDDQIIVRERVTGTNHLFYVAGLTDNYDATTGRWTYTLQLQWLGTPGALFPVSAISSSPVARAYVEAVSAL